MADGALLKTEERSREAKCRPDRVDRLREVADSKGYGPPADPCPRPAQAEAAGRSYGVITDDCPVTTSGFSEYVLVANVLVPLDGPHEVTISDNRITGMSSSGISVLGFFSELQKTVTQIRTRGLVIANNTIEDNYVHPSEPLPNSPFQSVSAVGGIVLADADSLRIRDNTIHRNGATHIYPVCGIYVLHGEDIVVENNLIRENGKRVPGAGIAGHRAGIALQFVGRALVDANGDLGAETDMLLPAARVRGNIVHQPAGRALQMYGLGPMFVEGNVLASEGLDGLTAAQTEFAAHCVEIQNLGQSPELQLVPHAPRLRRLRRRVRRRRRRPARRPARRRHGRPTLRHAVLRPPRRPQRRHPAGARHPERHGGELRR